jgi:hypothetical protein
LLFFVLDASEAKPGFVVDPWTTEKFIISLWVKCLKKDSTGLIFCPLPSSETITCTSNSDDAMENAQRININIEMA